MIISTILNSAKLGYEREKIDGNMNDILINELELLKMDGHFKYQIKSDVQLGELPKYNAVPSHLSQIFGNLVKNAVDELAKAVNYD